MSAVCDVTLMQDALVSAGAVITANHVCCTGDRIPASAIMASVTTTGDLAPVPEAKDCELHAQGLQPGGVRKQDSGSDCMWRLDLVASVQQLPQLWHDHTVRRHLQV